MHILWGTEYALVLLGSPKNRSSDSPSLFTDNHTHRILILEGKEDSVAITRDRCDCCRKPFQEGESVYRYTMLGSAPGFDGVEGEQIFLHSTCALLVTRVVREGSQRDKMVLANMLARSVREEREEDETPDPRLMLTAEQGRKLEEILKSGAPQWVNDLREALKNSATESTPLLPTDSRRKGGSYGRRRSV